MAEPGADPAPRAIALDGPAAAGKTTVGLRLARRLGMLCFDTGLIYRALTVVALRSGTSPEDADALLELLAREPIDVAPRPDLPGGSAVLAGGRDLTGQLRAPEVDATVSAVSRHAPVRQALLEAQRRIARQNAVIMLGRDIGTVVLPDADIKIYLDASAEARARRRLRERLAGGEPADYGSVLTDMRARDAKDAGRATAPLRPADDAVVVNTDRCDAEQVADHLATLVLRWPDPLTTEGGSAPCAPSSPSLA